MHASMYNNAFIHFVEMALLQWCKYKYTRYALREMQWSTNHEIIIIIFMAKFAYHQGESEVECVGECEDSKCCEIEWDEIEHWT